MSNHLGLHGRESWALVVSSQQEGKLVSGAQSLVKILSEDGLSKLDLKLSKGMGDL